MTDISGWSLENALAHLAAEGYPSPLVARVLPPRGEPWSDGQWRVVRADLSRGEITAALFPPDGRTPDAGADFRGVGRDGAVAVSGKDGENAEGGVGACRESI